MIKRYPTAVKNYNMSPFPTKCPPPSSWSIAEPSFDPEEIWSQETSLVKETEKRKVFKAKGYYIKAFKLLPWPAGRLRDPAKKEWRLSKILAERGLSPRPVAFGTWGKWSYFVSKEASGQVLEEYLKDSFVSLSRQRQKEIERKFAIFLKRLADSGILQPDFHLNNIFYQEKDDIFLMLDLHRARCENSPIHKLILDQLSFVLPPFMESVNGRAILETTLFLSELIPVLKDKGERYKIQNQAFGNMRRHWSKKGPRKIKQRQIRSRREGILEIRHINTDKAIQDLLLSIIKGPEKWLSETKTCTIIKDSRHTLCLRVSSQDQSFFIKAYRSSGTMKSLSYLVRTPRALRTWELSWQLAFRNIPVLLPLAAVQSRNPWKTIYGAVIFPWIKEVQATKAFVKSALEGPEDHFIKNISVFLWQMHERGVVHGDCKITNFVYSPEKRGQLMIFDLDATRIEKKLTSAQRISDIRRIGLSLEELVPGRPILGEIIRHYTRFHVPWQDKYKEIIDYAAPK